MGLYLTRPKMVNKRCLICVSDNADPRLSSCCVNCHRKDIEYIINNNRSFVYTATCFPNKENFDTFLWDLHGTSWFFNVYLDWFVKQDTKDTFENNYVALFYIIDRYQRNFDEGPFNFWMTFMKRTEPLLVLCKCTRNGCGGECLMVFDEIVCFRCWNNVCKDCYTTLQGGRETILHECDFETKATISTIKAMGNGVRSCPKCAILIQKKGGCSLMICGACRYRFSWNKCQLNNHQTYTLVFKHFHSNDGDDAWRDYQSSYYLDKRIPAYLKRLSKDGFKHFKINVLCFEMVCQRIRIKWCLKQFGRAEYMSLIKQAYVSYFAAYGFFNCVLVYFKDLYKASLGYNFWLFQKYAAYTKFKKQICNLGTVLGIEHFTSDKFDDDLIYNPEKVMLLVYPTIEKPMLKVLYDIKKFSCYGF
jgi:hypothetical protein